MKFSTYKEIFDKEDNLIQEEISFEEFKEYMEEQPFVLNMLTSKEKIVIRLIDEVHFNIYSYVLIIEKE